MDRVVLLFLVLFTLMLVPVLFMPEIAPGPPVEDRPVQKAAIFAPVAWHYLTVDETDAHITALPLYIRDYAKSSLLHKLYPLLARKEILYARGAEPLSIEQILLIKPDAVLTWEWFARELEQIRYPNVIKIRPFEDNAGELFLTLGGLTGKSGRAEALLARYDVRIAGVLRNVPANTDIPKVITIANENYFVWNADFKEFNRKMQILYASNAADKINGAVNLETLIMLNPDIIFLNDYANALSVEDICKNQALANVSAVKSRRVYRMPNGASMMTGPAEDPLLLSWLNRVIHPDIPYETSLRQEIKDTYLKIYGYNMDKNDIDTMLHMEENGHSAFYTQIFSN